MDQAGSKKGQCGGHIEQIRDQDNYLHSHRGEMVFYKFQLIIENVILMTNYVLETTF